MTNQEPMTSVLPTSTFAVDFHRVFVGSQVWLIVRLAAGLMVWLCSGPISFAGEKKPTDPPSNAESLELSRSRNLSACVICHQPAGQGVPSIYPPLAESGWVNGPSDRLVAIATYGLVGPIEVNGIIYPSVPMPSFGVEGSYQWGAKDIAAVATYIRQSWGKEASGVAPEQVGLIRKNLGRRGPLTSAKLD